MTGWNVVCYARPSYHLPIFHNPAQHSITTHHYHSMLDLPEDLYGDIPIDVIDNVITKADKDDDGLPCILTTKSTLTIFLHRTEAASSIIACLIHSSNLLQLNHFETHRSELQGDTNLLLAVLIFKGTQGILAFQITHEFLNGFIPNQRQPPQPVAIDVSCYCSDACNDFSKKLMR